MQCSVQDDASVRSAESEDSAMTPPTPQVSCWLNSLLLTLPKQILSLFDDLLFLFAHNTPL